jgi:hypothetical protein
MTSPPPPLPPSGPGAPAARNGGGCLKIFGTFLVVLIIVAALGWMALKALYIVYGWAVAGGGGAGGN